MHIDFDRVCIVQIMDKDFVKICDAKFPYNPFPEISEFLENRNNYLVELEHKKNEFVRTQKKLAITNEFIKANLTSMFDEKSKVLWQTEILEKEIKLTVEKDGNKNTINLTPENYLEQLQEYAKRCINNV